MSPPSLFSIVETPLTNIMDLLESTFKQCESFTWAGVCVVTTWPVPYANSSVERTKQVEEDSLVTMVMGLGSISFLLLDDDSLPVWDWDRLQVIKHAEPPNAKADRMYTRWRKYGLEMTGVVWIALFYERIIQSWLCFDFM